MRRAIVLAILLASATAFAQEGEAPKTRLAGVAAFAGNVGALGNQYAFGWMAGAEAGLQPGVLGVSWSILLGQLFVAADSEVNRAPFVIDMGLFVRARIRIPSGSGGIPAFIIMQAGGELIRSGVPLAPDDERSYIGPAVGLGGEMVLSDYILTFEGRYGLLAGGPAALKLLVSFGIGAK